MENENQTPHKRRVHYKGKYPKKFEEKYKDKYEIFEISTYTHQNIDKLLTRLYTVLQNTPFFHLFKEPEEDGEVTLTPNKAAYGKPDFEIKKDRFGRYVITGDRVIRTYHLINIMMKLLSYLTKIGVDEKLRELGAEDGSTVVLDDFEFEYYN